MSYPLVYPNISAALDAIQAPEAARHVPAGFIPRKALLVDYKTGDSERGAEDQLMAKHQTQADCYAPAALDWGIDEVDIRFVCLENLDETGEPVAIPYTLGKRDREAIKKRVAETRG